MGNPLPPGTLLNPPLGQKEKHRQQYSELIKAIEKLDLNIVPHYYNLIDYIGYYFNDLSARAPRDLLSTILYSVIKVTEFLSNKQNNLELPFQNLTKHILGLVHSELVQDSGTIQTALDRINCAINNGENPAYSVPKKETEG